MHCINANDNKNVKIGKVNLDSKDTNNLKSFEIRVDVPTDPKDLTKDYIKKINLVFKRIIPLMENPNLPEMPEPLDPSILKSLPRP